MNMRIAFFILTGLFVCITSFAQDERAKEDQAKGERLFQQYLKEVSVGVTNYDAGYSNAMRVIFFKTFLVSPEFGLRWNDVPAPDFVDSNSMASVRLFIETNGWNMDTNKYFYVDSKDAKLIRGLPWYSIKDREFNAVTHQGILYVLLKGWHYNLSGIAFNPNTNNFPDSITGFQPIGAHWYAWATPEDPIKLPQIYEGHKP
jgi:hypothetical protein